MKKHKINILDLSVILIVLLLIFAASVKFKNYNAEDGENSRLEKIEYVIRVGNIRKYTADAFEIGDNLYDSQTNVMIGKVIAKEIEPTTIYEKIENGELVKSEIPERYDLTLLLETDGSVTQDGYYANRSVELKVGSDKQIETLYAKTTGRITSIQVSGD